MENDFVDFVFIFGLMPRSKFQNLKSKGGDTQAANEGRL